MKKLCTVVSFAIAAVYLTGCQTTAQKYNGVVGYQIENQTKNSATLVYTLALRQNQKLDETKLIRACTDVLGKQNNYSIQVLSATEIANPEPAKTETLTKQLGNTRTSIGFSDTPSLYGSEGYAMRNSLDARPSTLRVVRYTCNIK